MKIVNVCLAAVVCFFLQFSAVAGAAVEMVVGEYNRSTGTNWYFPGKKVTYKVSDSSVAEVLQGKDGQYRVHFIAPGEVYVYATFYSQGQPLEPELYFDISTKSSNFHSYGLRLGVGVYLFKDQYKLKR